MAHFVLVHGAWHGAWCWDRLLPELEAAGHRGTAVELPAESAGLTFDDYAEVVVEHLGPDADDTIVVGHSLAGHTIPLVAARRPVARLVYLCALVPVPGSSFVEQFADEPEMLGSGYEAGMAEDGDGRRAWVDHELARRFMYADCDPVSARAALDRMRPQARSPYGVPCSLTSFPPAPATYIVCREDRLVNPDWSRRAARERLGADLVELPGSHSPFWSRPRELAGALDRLV